MRQCVGADIAGAAVADPIDRSEGRAGDGPAADSVVAEAKGRGKVGIDLGHEVAVVRPARQQAGYGGHGSAGRRGGPGRAKRQGGAARTSRERRLRQQYAPRRKSRGRVVGAVALHGERTLAQGAA